MTLVFVYGSLKQGFRNHHFLTGARLIAKTSTEPAFSMYQYGDFGGFPGVVAAGVTSVSGEVYEVDAETLAHLDRLEGHPRFYRRTQVMLRNGLCAEMYLLTAEQVAGFPLIASGNWEGRVTR